MTYQFFFELEIFYRGKTTLSLTTEINNFLEVVVDFPEKNLTLIFQVHFFVLPYLVYRMIVLVDLPYLVHQCTITGKLKFSLIEKK